MAVKHVEKEAAYLIVERKQGLVDQGSPSKSCPLEPILQARSLPSKVSATSQNSATSWGPSIQHIRLRETFHIQTITVNIEYFPQEIAF
jgi:hypothetical protein